MGEDILDIERVLLQDVRVGRLYMWSGTIRNLPADASIFVIAKSPGVHPQARLEWQRSRTKWRELPAVAGFTIGELIEQRDVDRRGLLLTRRPPGI